MRKTNSRAAKCTHAKRLRIYGTRPVPLPENIAARPSRLGTTPAAKQKTPGPMRGAKPSERWAMREHAHGRFRTMPKTTSEKIRPRQYSPRSAWGLSWDSFSGADRDLLNGWRKSAAAAPNAPDRFLRQAGAAG